MRTAYCFDLDGTVTTAEVLPCIGADLGIADEIATLTRATMDGHIPFEASFRLRCAILGQVPAERVRKIVAAIPLNERIVAFTNERPEECFLVTGNLDIWIEPVVHRCGCGIFCSTAVEEEGRLRILHILNKNDAIHDLRSSGRFDRIVSVGDGANDIGMLQTSDVAIAFGEVHAPASEAIRVSHYVVNCGEALCTLLKAL
jgi:phosphoserine phosphatase